MRPPTFRRAILVNAVRAGLIFVISATGGAWAEVRKKSGYRVVAQPNDRCFVFCLDGCQISRGPHFNDSQVIYDENEGVVSSLKEMMGWREPRMPIFDVLLQLQMSQDCPLSPSFSRCRIAWDGTGRWGVSTFQVQVEAGTEVRVVAHHLQHAFALSLVDHLVEAGQCRN